MSRARCLAVMKPSRGGRVFKAALSAVSTFLARSLTRDGSRCTLLRINLSQKCLSKKEGGRVAVDLFLSGMRIGGFQSNKAWISSRTQVGARPAE